MGSREVSEKARALVLIGIEWQNDTDYYDGRLRREAVIPNDLLGPSGMVEDVQTFVSTTISSGPSDTRWKPRHFPLDRGHGLCSSCSHHCPLILNPFKHSLRLWQVISHASY